MTVLVTAWRIARRGLPLSASQLLTFSLGFVDAAMLSALGPAPLAGGGLGLAVFSVIGVTGASLLAGVTPLAGAAWAAEDPRAFVTTVATAMRLAVRFGILLLLLMLIGGELLGSAQLHRPKKSSVRPGRSSPLPV